MKTWLARGVRLGVAMLGVGWGAITLAQDIAYPNRTVRIVIPTPPGGAVDAMARAIGEKLSAEWKQAVVVDNRPGANGMIAYTHVARAEPDGLTILVSISSLVQTVVAYANPTYRLEELAPAGLVAYLPNAFALNSDIPASDFAAFLEYAKQRPDAGLSFGSSGAGSSGHLAGAMLWQSAGVDVMHVPFRGEAPAIQAAMAGQITGVMGATGSIMQQVQSGRLRPMAVAAPQRLRRYPDLPTFTDLGYPEANLAGWSAVMVPAGTPAAIIERIHAGFNRAVQQPDVSARIEDMGFEPTSMPPAEVSRFLQAEVERWREAFARTGVTVD